MDFLSIGGRQHHPRPDAANSKRGFVRILEAWGNWPPRMGVLLVGIYFSMFGSEKHSGACKTVWRLDSYERDGSDGCCPPSKCPELARLLDELEGFFDIRIWSRLERELLENPSATRPSLRTIPKPSAQDPTRSEPSQCGPGALRVRCDSGRPTSPGAWSQSAAQQLAEADPAGWAIGRGAWPAGVRDNPGVCLLPPGSLARGR